MSVSYGSPPAASRQGGERNLSVASAIHAIESRSGGVINPLVTIHLAAWCPIRPTPMGYRPCKPRVIYFSAQHGVTVAEYVREYLDDETGFTDVTTYLFTWWNGEFRELEAPQHSRHRV